MKAYLLPGASALAMIAAVPALAQSNESTVTQTGTNTVAAITQSGTDGI